jgi:hypothetical protein
MALPRAPSLSKESESHFTWPLLPPEGAHTEWFEALTAVPGFWGEVAERTTRVSMVRTVLLRIAAITPITETEKQATAVAGAAFEWVELFSNWLASLRGIVFAMDSAAHHYGWVGFQTRLGNEARRIGSVTMVGPPMTMRPVDIERAPTLKDWSRAASAASAGEQLPVEHTLLNLARLRLHEMDAREAVVAATSAAEVALTKGLRRKLEPKNETHVLDLLLDVDGFGRLRRLASKLGIECPPQQETDEMSKTRNAVIHDGATPHIFEAMRAVETATKIVELHSPSSLLLAAGG